MLTSLQESDSRLVSQDETPHWVLWDLTTRRAVLEGDDGQAVLAGTTLAVAGGGLLRVHDAATGALRFSIPTSPAQFGVARDGSYVWTADSSVLSLWLSLDGHNIVTRSGAYDTAQLFALKTLHHLRVLHVDHCHKFPLTQLAKNPSLGNLTHLLIWPHARDSAAAPALATCSRSR